MIDKLPPGAVLIVGALLLPLLPGRLRQVWLVLLPILSGLALLALPDGPPLLFEVFGYTLTPVRVDGLSLVWGYVFHLAALLSAVYAVHVKDTGQHVAAMLYAGAAIGAVFAGDLITLFIYWELTAVSSVFLIWASRNERAYQAGMRYLIIQVGSGVLLLAGILFHFQQYDSIAFGLLTEELEAGAIGAWLILLAFGIKCAFPLLHNWLIDAYPEATVTGTVFLSAFTTKLAVYALARGFAGMELLIWIGAGMAVFPIFYAIIENDLRRLLSYSLINQLGFMVVGVGIGTDLAISGAAGHAFAHILYKSLLFMTIGAVLYRTGTAKASELGGLYKSMPWTALFCIVGTASIAAFPLTCGFVTKSIIQSELAENHHTAAWLALLFAAAAMFLPDLKVVFRSFFGRDRGLRVAEAPPNMLLAMGAAAGMCLAIGVLPQVFYRLLPYAVDYEPYTSFHVVAQLQLLGFAGLAFVVLLRAGLLPVDVRSVNLDLDWIYRRAVPLVVLRVARTESRLRAAVSLGLDRGFNAVLRSVYRHHGPEGILARTWPTGSTVLWVAVILVGFLVLYYL